MYYVFVIYNKCYRVYLFNYVLSIRYQIRVMIWYLLFSKRVGFKTFFLQFLVINMFIRDINNKKVFVVSLTPFNKLKLKIKKEFDLLN